MAKNCLIYETLNAVKSMNVQKTKDGLMHLSGVFGVCGVRNNNSRIYETKNYAKMVEAMKQRISKSPIPGELEHPQTMNITLENISHRIDSIDIDENGVVSGEITLLDTPKGKIAQAIVEGGLPLFISSRATGNVDPKSGMVTLENLQTYDLVGSPGFSQAELHLNENQVAESICESVYYITEKNDVNIENNNNNNDMEMTEILEKLSILEQKIADLEQENNDLRESLEDLEENNQQIDIEKLANGIQNWIVEEYSPVVQNWIVEQFANEFKSDIIDEAVDQAVSEAVNEASSNFVNETAPKIQNWIVNEFSPVVENWCCTELASGVQDWIIEEFSPEVENWLNESYSEKIDDRINDTVVAAVETAVTESKINEKKDNLNAIDETLKLLESIDVQKPTYSRKNTMVTENINEPKYIAEMPDMARVQWEMASQDVKESIERRAKLYNFTVEGAVEKFWEGIDFKSIKPVSNIYEGLDNIMDARERSIRSQFRSWRSRR